MGASCGCSHNRSFTAEFNPDEVAQSPTLPDLTRAQLLKDFLAAGRADGRRQTVVRRCRAPVLPEHSGIFALHLESSATMGNNHLREKMQQPWGVGRNEWIGAKTVTIFEEVVHLVTVLDGTCTPETCPTMSCGKNITYEWADEHSTTTQRMPAIEYMATLIEWGHQMLSNPGVVPQDGGEFPDHFLPCMQMLHKRLFRVYAHTYLHHFAEVQEHGGEAHLNFLFKHWLFFVRMFNLVGEDSLAPLKHLIAKFEAKQAEAEAIRGGMAPAPAPAVGVDVQALARRR